MKLSLKQRLLNYLRKQYPNEVAGGELERLTMQNTKHTASNCSRRLRELENDGLITVEHREKNHAHYRATEPKTVETIVVPVLEKTITQKIW